ncbi:DUF3102 domain-containing protein [Ovoidimarina sediminis]|uniref:DUF3102 domain-containing protein n=1 Tax=Ovoidimarina sediminis TaxID=3079856 RepID=UPI00290E8D81|nr:DUF3102 domain-containing protein [Rhodophyticola sp. MJ-SS7]MDU8946116.1 DUF3102 domain-containing protein [Rhodophyticola sp. MJ-SS7]
MTVCDTALQVSQWSHAIRARWQDSVDAILDVGRMLTEAKANLPHGQFGRLFAEDNPERLPFTDATARKLMAISRHAALGNRAHVHALPPAWGTLYELSKLPEDKLEGAFSAGLIHPEMERQDAVALVGGKSPRLNYTGDYEWYTPGPIIEKARAVLGGFDLDPATSVIANRVVQAEQIFIVEDDGLEQD